MVVQWCDIPLGVQLTQEDNMRTVEQLWNISPWNDAALIARWILTGVSLFMAAHYLASLNVPQVIARQILLGY